MSAPFKPIRHCTDGHYSIQVGPSSWIYDRERDMEAKAAVADAAAAPCGDEPGGEEDSGE